jgi:HEAT repeat protein
MGKDARPAIAPLTDALKDGEAQVRFAAASALGEFGRDARAVIPDLLAVLSNDPDPMVQAAAAASLGRIEPTRVTSSVRTVAQTISKSNTLQPLEQRIQAFAKKINPSREHALDLVFATYVTGLSYNGNDQRILNAYNAAQGALEYLGVDGIPAIVRAYNLYGDISYYIPDPNADDG